MSGAGVAMAERNLLEVRDLTVEFATEDYPFLDLRVDDHAEPLAELRRIHAVSLERFQPFMSCLASRANATGITDRAVIEAEIARFNAARTR